MPLAQRRAEVEWVGTLEQGKGGFSVGNWMVGEVPVTWASRVESAETSTSPEELIAAAHASCYAMALSLVLGRMGATPERVHVSAVCTLDEVDGAFRITAVDLDVRGRAGGLDDKGFREATEEAHRVCPVSNALKDNVEIRVNAATE